MEQQGRLSFLGVPITFRPTAIVPGLFAATVIYGLRRHKDDRWRLALLAPLVWYKADAIHVGGHIISSQMANAPMDYIDVGIYPASGYLNHDVSPQQHIARASGGPIASALAALLCAIVFRMLPPGLLRTVAGMACFQNVFLLAVGLAPLERVDGGVIYANFRNMRDNAPTHT